ncbi:MAG: DUF4340 domain-containing protein [Planctomycetes bacterium]|nr:DUF4340 domain-containing protein [Planctomycetota bacterium]
MNWRTTVILLATVVALSLFVWLFEQHRTPVAKAKEQAKLVAPGFADKREDVSRIVIERPYARVETTDTAGNGAAGGAIQKIELKKTGDETWRITSPVSYPADRYRARGLISGLAYLEKRAVNQNAEEVLAITCAGEKLQPAKYGLDEANRIRIAYYGKPSGEGDGEEQLLAEVHLASEKLMGDEMLYAARPETVEQEVYVVNDALYSDAMAPLDSLRSNRLLEGLSTSGIASLEVTRRDGTLAFIKKGLDWFMTKPMKDLCRAQAVEDAVNAVAGLNIRLYVEDSPEDVVQYGLDRPRYRVTAADADGTPRVVLVGRDVAPEDPEAAPEYAYAMLEGQPTVVTVPGSFREKLDKAVNEFRLDKLLAFPSEKASRVVIERPDQPLIDLRQADGDWKFIEPAPYDADEDAVNNLVADLNNTHVKEFLPAVLPPSDERLAASGAIRATVSFDATTNLPPVRALFVPATAEEIQAWRLLPEGKAAADTPYDPQNAYLLDKSTYRALLKPLLDFRSRDMADFDTDKAVRMEITTPAGRHVAVKDRDKWKLEEPGGSLDSGRLEDILWRAATLRAEKLVGERTGEEELAKYGLGAQAVRLKIDTGGAALELLLGNGMRLGTFAKLADSPMVFVVAAGDNGLEQLCRDGLLKGAKLFPVPEEPKPAPAEKTGGEETEGAPEVPAVEKPAEEQPATPAETVAPAPETEGDAVEETAPAEDAGRDTQPPEEAETEENTQEPAGDADEDTAPAEDAAEGPPAAAEEEEAEPVPATVD